MAYGEVEKSSRYLLRESAGTAKRKNDDGTEYHLELAMALGTGCPIVTCKETGKTFILSWQDILQLAEEAGTFNPWEQE